MYLLYEKYLYLKKIYLKKSCKYQEAQNISNRPTVNLFIYKLGRVKDEYLEYFSSV